MYGLLRRKFLLSIWPNMCMRSTNIFSLSVVKKELHLKTISDETTIILFFLVPILLLYFHYALLHLVLYTNDLD